MALFYLAAADASVACWDAKYVYNFWRPQAAIARGRRGRQRRDAGDPAWRPLVPTPPHPDYASGHTANSGAMAFVLACCSTTRRGSSSRRPARQTRIRAPWQTFSEGVKEVIDARVYSGIHFRTADEVGAPGGRSRGSS